MDDGTYGTESKKKCADPTVSIHLLKQERAAPENSTSRTMSDSTIRRVKLPEEPIDLEALRKGLDELTKIFDNGARTVEELSPHMDTMGYRINTLGINVHNKPTNMQTNLDARMITMETNFNAGINILETTVENLRQENTAQLSTWCVSSIHVPMYAS
jgi:hypothetical protein